MVGSADVPGGREPTREIEIIEVDGNRARTFCIGQFASWVAVNSMTKTKKTASVLEIGLAL